jgi:monoamine oxidase
VATSRREFLGAAVAVGAGLAVRPLRVLDRPDAATPRRVVVVGAGLAGLTAALDLRGAGWDVVVLEARDRVGGRVLTARDSFGGGQIAELGGESIDDNHHAIRALVAEYGLRTAARPPGRDERATIFRRGRRRTAAQYVSQRGGKVLEDYDRYYESIDRLGENVDDPSRPEATPHATRFDRRSLADHLDALDLVPEARWVVEREETAEYAIDPRHLSLLFVMQQAAVVADVPDSAAETMRIAEGNDALPHAMAVALGDAVRLGAPVTRIDRSAGSVSVHTRDTSFTGAHVVLAVPPPVARRIEFRPGLPAAVRSALAAVDLGPAVKVLQQYPERFWRAGGASGVLVTDQPFALGWDATDSVPGPEGILTTFTTGRRGTAFARLDAATRTRLVNRQLVRMFGPVAASPTATATEAWPDERYTRGGYAYFSPGRFLSTWPVLHAAHGRLHFAGEHTETLAGYMESAARSGHRVARRIGAPPGV